MRLHVLAILWLLISSMVIDTIRDTSFSSCESIEWSDIDDIEDKETKEEKKAENEKMLNQFTTLVLSNQNEKNQNRPKFEIILITQNIKSSDNQPPELV